MDQNKLVLFEGNKIRRTLHDGEWWFAINDVIGVLADSNDPYQYFKKLRSRDPALAKMMQKGGVQVVPPLPLEIETAGGKQIMSCWNTKGIFRLIQSIPSTKAEPFKRWLSQVGYERIQEIQNPELAQERMKQIYKQKGYSDDWIEKRMRGIAIRQDLTEEWHQRGITDNRDFAILTAEISKATFGVTPSEHKKLKSLKQENLRDHMTDLELIFNMLGEKVTTEISKQEKPATLDKSKNVARRGGSVAGVARKATEKELGKPVVSKENYLTSPQDKKLIKDKSGMW